MIHIYLDDSRRCPQGFVLAKSAEECILLLQECEVDILSLDFDLGWNHPNGGEVARWIAHSGKYPRRIYLHTSSHAGKIMMYDLLYQSKPDGVALHQSPMPEALLMQIAEQAAGAADRKVNGH